jgi:hypothetical protein
VEYCSTIEEGAGIAVDSSGNAYVTGTTLSTDFPTAGPFQPAHAGRSDVFVTKINASGSALIYSTYLGGGPTADDPFAGYDSGSDIAVDSSGNAYVTGGTDSTNFPTANAFQSTGVASNAFVTKLNSTGSALLYSTYLGGNGGEGGSEIEVDSAGNAYVVGSTSSTNFPTANPIQPVLKGGGDVFVTKFNALGSALVFSTYLGGRDNAVAPIIKSRVICLVVQPNALHGIVEIAGRFVPVEKSDHIPARRDAELFVKFVGRDLPQLILGEQWDFGPHGRVVEPVEIDAPQPVAKERRPHSQFDGAALAHAL